MRHNIKIRQEAIRLRVEERKSVPEIKTLLNLPKRTVAWWLEKYPLTKKELKEREVINIKRGTFSSKKYFDGLDTKFKKVACKKYALYRNDPFFMFGLGTYLGEGNKTSYVGLTNMNPNIIQLFKKWFER